MWRRPNLASILLLRAPLIFQDGARLGRVRLVQVWPLSGLPESLPCRAERDSGAQGSAMFQCLTADIIADGVDLASYLPVCVIGDATASRTERGGSRR